NSSDPLPQRRWRVRMVLSIVLLALVLVGSRLEWSTNNSSAPPTISSTATSTRSTGTSTDLTTTTTTSPPTSSTTSPPLAWDPLTLNEPSHGCGFVMSNGYT